MPIRLPSKNIYSKKNTMGVDSVVGTVEIATTNLEEVLTHGIAYNNNSVKPSQYEQTFADRALVYYQLSAYRHNESSSFSFSYAGYHDTYKWDIAIYIPKKQSDKRVINLDFSRYGFDNNSVEIQIRGDIESGSSEGTVTIGKNPNSSGYGDTPFIVTEISHRLGAVATTQKDVTIMDNLPAVESSHSNDKTGDNRLTSYAKIEYSSDASYLSTSYLEDNQDYYLFHLRIVAGTYSVTLGGDDYKQTSGSAVYPDLSGSYTVTGTYKRYVPTHLVISFNGRMYQYKISEKDFTIRSSVSYEYGSISIGNNEFIQYDNEYELEDGSFGNALNYLYNKTLNSYKNGKEIATLRCSISDYYDYESGGKAISIDKSTGKMSFELYDQVIPMVYGANGEDRPMSLYKDGTPKVFSVLGVRKFYDGAVWQELSLQEVDKSEIV
jgi:hypothetical protein